MNHGQFYHYETYGREISTANKKKGSSLYTILGEAFREPDYSSHVDKDDTEKFPPEIIFGMDFERNLTNKEKLEAQKNQLIELAESYAKSKGLKKKDGCILAGIVSYPPETTKEMMYFIKTFFVLPFLFKKWGNNLRCVITHGDEYFWDDEKKEKTPHFQDHFYVIPDANDNIRLTDLHAGIAAKRLAIRKKEEKPSKEKQRSIWVANIPVKYKTSVEQIVNNYDLTEKQIKNVCEKMVGSIIDILCRDESRKAKNSKDIIPNKKAQRSIWVANIPEKYKTSIEHIMNEYDLTEERIKNICVNIKGSIIDILCELESKKKYSDQAYNDAMRLEQDVFFNEVGVCAGWARTTVNGIRFPREKVKGWKKSQKELKQQKNKIVMEQEQIIQKAKEDAEKIKEEAKAYLDKAKETWDKAVGKASHTEEKAYNDEERILDETHKEQALILAAIKGDLVEKNVPEPKTKETTTNYFDRITNWLKGIILNIKEKEKTLEKKEAELDEKKKAVDVQLSRLVGNYGEENQIRQAIKLLQEKLATLGKSKTNKQTEEKKKKKI